MAEAWCKNTHTLVEQLRESCGAQQVFGGDYFGECALRFNTDAKELHIRLLNKGYLAGLPIEIPNEPDALLLCATETKTAEDIEGLVAAVRECL